MNTGATILDLDYLSDESIAKAANDYEHDSLDILINCAGRSFKTSDKNESPLTRNKGVDVHPRAWLENGSSDLMTKFRIMTVVSSHNSWCTLNGIITLKPIGAFPSNQAFSSYVE